MTHQTVARPARLAIALISFVTSVLAQQCYYPDGITAQANDVPCNASATASPCCNKQDLCLDDGLCLHAGIISRGSCTDRLWGEGCPQWCKQVNNASGLSLFPCNPFGSVFSCEWGNCDTPFPITGGSAVILREDQVKPLGSPNAIALSATQVLSVASATATGSSNNTFSQTAATGNPNAKYTASDMAAVGAGIGIPLLLALFGAIFLLLKKQKPRKEESQPLAPDSHSAMQQSFHSQTAQLASAFQRNGPAEKSGQSTAYANYGSHYVGELDGGRETQELSGHQTSEIYSSPR